MKDDQRKVVYLFLPKLYPINSFATLILNFFSLSADRVLRKRSGYCIQGDNSQRVCLDDKEQ